MYTTTWNPNEMPCPAPGPVPSRHRNLLRYTGLVLLIVGVTLMPIPVTDPKAVTSVFPWVAWSGVLVKYGAWAMTVGAALLALSFALRSRE